MKITPFLFLLGFLAPLAVYGETTLDAIVASVDGKPITLHEAAVRAKKEEVKSLRAAAEDPDIQRAVEQIIYEQLIRAEAEQRRLSVSPDEVERYFAEISAQNNMTPEEFQRALVAQGNSLEAYKQQVEVDILRSKLMSSLFRSGVGVSDQEVEAYIEEHPELQRSGSKLKLRQIFLAPGDRTEQEIQDFLLRISEEQPDPERFAGYAEAHSQGIEAQEGGLLGIVHEQELSPLISDAVSELDEGDTSQLVRSPSGYHLFLVEQRYGGEDSDKEALYDEVRSILRGIKTKERLQTFITDELYDRHAVDKKI